MRKLTSILATTALLTGAVVGVAAAEDRRGNSADSIVGAWDADIIPGGHTPDDGSDDLYPAFDNVAVFHADGTVVNTDTIVAAGGGVWERVGKRTFRGRTVHLNLLTGAGQRTLDVFGLTNESTARVDVTFEVTLSEDGSTATGTYVTEFITDAGETATLSSGGPAIVSGAVEWSRIGLRDDVELP